jgi:hypothetical protein
MNLNRFSSRQRENIEQATSEALRSGPQVVMTWVWCPLFSSRRVT